MQKGEQENNPAVAIPLFRQALEASKKLENTMQFSVDRTMSLNPPLAEQYREVLNKVEMIKNDLENKLS